MGWRNCYASDVLLAEINARYPGRDKASDGTIGDAAHATRASDHNPWFQLGGEGIVRARDVDKDGVDAAGIVEYLRKLGAKGDPRLYPGGYLIFNRRITKPDFTGWSVYTGTNAHKHHFHVSFSTVSLGFDSRASWGIAAATPAPIDIAKIGTLSRKDDPMSPISIDVRPDGRFHTTVLVEAGESSLAVARAFITFGSAWGGTQFKVSCLNASGVVMPGQFEGPIDNNRRRALEIPSGAVMATIEGLILGPGAVPGASLVAIPKTPAA